MGYLGAKPLSLPKGISSKDAKRLERAQRAKNTLPRMSSDLNSAAVLIFDFTNIYF